MLTRQTIAQHLGDYLNQRTSLNLLVDWAEKAIMEGGAEEGSEKLIMQSLGRIAAADVKEFGLLWEDCEDIMQQLGFIIKVDVPKGGIIAVWSLQISMGIDENILVGIGTIVLGVLLFWVQKRRSRGSTGYLIIKL